MNQLQPHTIDISMEVSTCDLNGNVKQKEVKKLPFISPFLKIRDKLFPGRSFVSGFLDSLIDIMTNGVNGDSTYDVAAGANTDFGILCGWDVGSINTIDYVSPADTFSGKSSRLNLPASNSGIYGATSLDAALSTLTINGVEGRRFQMRRTLTNSSTQKTIREVMLAAKKGSDAAKLYSRDAYLPYKADAINLLPKGEVLPPTDVLDIAFDIVCAMKKNGIVIHENFVKYIYNALFQKTVGSHLSMISSAGATVAPAIDSYLVKATPDVAGSKGLDIMLLEPADFEVSGHQFQVATSDYSAVPTMGTKVNSTFATKTLSLNGGSSSSVIDGQESSFTIEKTFSGHQSDFPLRAAVLYQEDTTPTPDARMRLVSWENEETDVSGVKVVTVNEILKVVFKFTVNCGGYTVINPDKTVVVSQQ